jgi:hypothetical protein
VLIPGDDHEVEVAFANDSLFDAGNALTGRVIAIDVRIVYAQKIRGLVVQYIAQPLPVRVNLTREAMFMGYQLHKGWFT